MPERVNFDMSNETGNGGMRIRLDVNLGEDTLESLTSFVVPSHKGDVMVAREAVKELRRRVGEKGNRFGVLVDADKNPDTARRAKYPLLVSRAAQIVEVYVDEEPQIETTAEQTSTQPSELTPRQKLMLPLARLINDLFDKVCAEDVATEVVVARDIEAGGLSGLVSTQEGPAREAKAELMQAVANERAEMLLVRLLELLDTNSDYLVAGARDAGLVAIFQELADLNAPTDPDPALPLSYETAGEWPVPAEEEGVISLPEADQLDPTGTDGI